MKLSFLKLHVCVTLCFACKTVVDLLQVQKVTRAFCFLNLQSCSFLFVCLNAPRCNEKQTNNATFPCPGSAHGQPCCIMDIVLEVQKLMYIFRFLILHFILSNRRPTESIGNNESFQFNEYVYMHVGATISALEYGIYTSPPPLPLKICKLIHVCI